MFEYLFEFLNESIRAAYDFLFGDGLEFAFMVGLQRIKLINNQILAFTDIMTQVQ